jgi:hypothetical protein
MTIHYGVDFGVERASDVLNDISGEASSDPSGKQVEGIMMDHLGRSLREVDRRGRIDYGFKNSRPEGVEILVLDNFQANLEGKFHGKRVAYVAEQALSQPGVEVLRQQYRGLYDLAGQLLRIAGSENPPEVINLSHGKGPAEVFKKYFPAFLSSFEEEHGADFSRWSADTRQEFKDNVQKLAEHAVDDFNSILGDTTQELENAVQALLDKGVTVVISAGNSGDLQGMLNELDVNIPDGFFGSVYGQAVNADGVIVVGATDAEGQPADFSSPTGFTDVAAEGDQVPVNRRDGLGSGTSYAAPKVAALVADILTIRPELTPADVEAIIRKSASPVAGAEKSLGAGLVNPDKALELARRWAPSADLPDKDKTCPQISVQI